MSTHESMKTLLLMRHAKAGANVPGLADSDRPLNDQGKRAAELVGRFINRESVRLDLILSSSAVRARETIEIVMKTAALRTELRFDRRIYEPGPLPLVEVISQIEEDKRAVMLVGHNPSLEELLRRFTGRVDQMKPGTLAQISFGTTKWHKAEEMKGSLDWLVNPKELESDQ